MAMNKDDKELFFKAQKKVRRLQIFYLHLVLYLIVVALISYNFYIMDAGAYTSMITGVNVSTLVLWGVFICLHAWSVFKGRLFFKKSWEDKKIEEYLKGKDKEESTFWE